MVHFQATFLTFNSRSHSCDFSQLLSILKLYNLWLSNFSLSMTCTYQCARPWRGTRWCRRGPFSDQLCTPCGRQANDDLKY